MATQWQLQSEAEHLAAEKAGHEIQARLQVGVVMGGA